MELGQCPAHPGAALTPLFDAKDRFWGFDGTLLLALLGDAGVLRIVARRRSS